MKEKRRKLKKCRLTRFSRLTATGKIVIVQASRCVLLVMIPKTRQTGGMNTLTTTGFFTTADKPFISPGDALGVGGSVRRRGFTSQPPGKRGESEIMQVLTGTKREITIMQWQEQLEKYMKRANDSMECFRHYHEADDLIHLSEDCEKLIELCNHTKEAINFMEAHGIK